MMGIVMFTVKPDNGPDYTVEQKLLAIAISLVAGLVFVSPLVYKGLRLRGMLIEAYERGMRFSDKRGEALFLYTEVQQLRRRIQRLGGLISLTFVLPDGKSYTANVNRPQDARMLLDVLTRFGPIQWTADNTFRFW
jgi:hypothetical protein